MTYVGTTGDDKRVGTGKGDVFDMSQGGDDTVLAGGGSDSIHFGGALTARDHLSGEAGSDTLELDGDYSSGLVLGRVNYDSIERLILGAGHSYAVRIADLSNINASTYGTFEYISAASLSRRDHAYIDGSDVKDISMTFLDGRGNDSFAGGGADDVFSLTTGGSDTALGGGGNDKINCDDARGAVQLDGGDGNDAIYFETYDQVSPHNRDTLFGGAGQDELTIKGIFDQLIKLSAADFSGFEGWILRTDGAHFRLGDGTLSAGPDGYCLIDGSQTLGGSSITIDAGQVSDVGVHFKAGTGNDWLRGGDANDLFDLGGSSSGIDTVFAGGGDDVVHAEDSSGSATMDSMFDGGAGYDTLVLNLGGSEAILNAQSVVGFEQLDVNCSKLHLNDATVASGATLHVQSTGVRSVIDGSAERDGHLDITGDGSIYGGAASDTLAGGWDADFLKGGGGNDVLYGLGPDRLVGGAGADRFVILGLGTADHGVVGSIADLQAIDFVDLSMIDANLNIAGNQAFHFVTSFTNHAGEVVLEYSAEQHQSYIIMDCIGNGSSYLYLDIDGDQRRFANYVL
jgi:Ca2+-binding RTX toxin-like protein